MDDRFTGTTGRRILREKLKEQRLIAGNAELADQVASSGDLVHVPTGRAIIQQGNDDNDVYLILEGSFDVVVNDRVVASKFPNDHVGEMAAVRPTQRRSASVVAREPAIVIKLAEPQFSRLSAQYPRMLLYIAKEIASRQEQRNARFMELYGMV